MSQHEPSGLPTTPGEFFDNFGAQLEGLAVLAGGILVYTLIVTMFYQIISHRVMFAREKAPGVYRSGFTGWLFYITTFPLVSFGFFAMLSLALIFLSDASQDALPIFTLAMAILAAVRIAAYFNEAASHDLAKLLPLGLLGVFLVRFETTSLKTAFEQLLTVADHWQVLAVFFLLIVALEYTLRFVRAMYLLARGQTLGGSDDSI